ncbi:MAG: hypothetical protein EOP85_01260 [Verrucomicrobiaceae bacterium]|nr:MAG: hypothetical protein EOP85_01260 [Verrucomicrobiaceae bacterium]
MNWVGTSTLMNRFYEIGVAGQLSLFFFVATLAFAVLIQVRKLEVRFRLALVPLSLLPLVLGIFGAASGAIRSINWLRTACVYDPFQGFVHFSEALYVLPLGAAGSAILLIVAAVALMLSPDRKQRPDP